MAERKSRVCKCDGSDYKWLVYEQKWICEECHKPPRRIASTFLHLPPVPGVSEVRNTRVAEETPTTLCGEHRRQQVSPDASEVTCERCMLVIKKRPQLANWIRLNAEEPAA